MKILIALEIEADEDLAFLKAFDIQLPAVAGSFFHVMCGDKSHHLVVKEVHEFVGEGIVVVFCDSVEPPPDASIEICNMLAAKFSSDKSWIKFGSEYDVYNVSHLRKVLS